MEIRTENPRTGSYLVSEANGTRSREEVTINATQGKLVPGTVIAKITAANAGVATAGSANEGTASMSAVTVASSAITGTYTVVVTAAAEGEAPAEFRVTDPFGNTADGVMGAAFTGLGLTFTITDGVEGVETGPAEEGDSWTIAVVEGIGEWGPYTPGASNGLQLAKGVLYAYADATSADRRATAHVRDCEVAAEGLVGLDSTSAAALSAAGIILR